MSRKIKLAKVSSMYPGYLAGLYAQNPGAENWSYADQYRLVMDGGFGWADFWKRHLESTGRFEVMEVVLNAVPLQRAWAREHGIADTAPGWPDEVIVHQIASFAPEIFFPHDFHVLRQGVRARIAREAPSIRRRIFYDGIAYCRAEEFPDCDLMLSCIQPIVDRYRRAGLRADLFRLGFEHTLLQRVALPAARPTPAIFIGSVALRPYAHLQRLEVLAELAANPGVAFHLNAPAPRDIAAHAVKLSLERKGSQLVRLPADTLRLQRLRRRNQGAVYGLQMYRALADAAVCLNVHIDAAGNAAGNMRLFEATGMGCCLLTDEKENLKDLFRLDEEVVTFRSKAECAEKLNHLIAHPEEARRIGEASQRRTLRDYRLDTQVLRLADTLSALCD